MSALRPSRIDPVQIGTLVSDSELAAADSVLAAIIASRASQQSVDSLGSTLGPAIVNATADKATAVQVAAARTALEAALSTATAPLSTATALAAVQTALTNADSANKTAILAGQASAKTALDASILAAGPQPGDVKLITNNTGIAPTGWTRASGMFTPAGLYDQNRFGLSTHPVTITCNNSSFLYQVLPSIVGTAFNVATGAVTSIAAHPVVSAGFSGSQVATDTYVYTFGGAANGLGTIYSDVRRLTLATNTWSSLVSLPAVRHLATAGELGNGNFPVVGGQTAAALTIANLSETMYVVNPTANTVATVALGFRSYGGRFLKLSNGVHAGKGLLWFPANQTTNGPSAASTYVVTPRAFLIGIDTSVTEIDGMTGTAIYETADGRIVDVATVPSASKIHDLTAAFGSQTVVYPLAAPTGLTLGGTPMQNAKVTVGGYLPVTHGTLSVLLYTGTLPANASQAFFVVKN